MNAEWETCKKHLSLKDCLMEFCKYSWKKPTTNQPWSKIVQSVKNTKDPFSKHKNLWPKTFTLGGLKQSRGRLDCWFWGGLKMVLSNRNGRSQWGVVSQLRVSQNQGFVGGGVMGKQAWQEASKVSPLPTPANFAEAAHGIFLGISVPVGPGTVIRFDNQTCHVSLISWRTHSFGLHLNIPWPSSSFWDTFKVLWFSFSLCSSKSGWLDWHERLWPCS